MGNKISSDPCNDNLTDIEYLEHMIPHHQVAIDMSNMLIKKTNNPIMLDLCRRIIQIQGYEIWEMEMLKRKINENLFSNINGDTSDNLDTLDIYNPTLSRDKDGKCDPKFFRPDAHMKHMSNMDINEKMYLEHMIPHHQVAINMSYRLLKYTNNSYLLEFSRNLIIEQKGEIFYMNNLLKSKNHHVLKIEDIHNHH